MIILSSYPVTDMDSLPHHGINNVVLLNEVEVWVTLTLSSRLLVETFWMSDDWKGFVLCFMLVNLPGDSTLQWAMFSVPGNTWFDVKNLVLCCVYIVLYLNTIVLSTTELMDGNLPCNHDSWSTCAQCWFVWYFSSAVIYSRGNVACVHVHVVHLVGDTGECNCETANLLLLLLQLFVWFVMYMYVWCCCMSPHSVATASDICSCYTAPPPLPSLGHVWDVMLVWRKGNIEKTVSVLQYCVMCTIIMARKDTSSSYRLVDCIGLWSCLV